MAVLILFAICVSLIDAAVYKTNIIWGDYHRPEWSEDVVITYDEWIGDIPGQIWSVEGIVLPMSTSGRPSAPAPYNGYPTGTAYGLDKGHIMALSNGGPDISLNIVPQSAQWQRAGGWRQLEIAVYNFALNKYGWNEVPHAAEIENMTSPNSCYVVFEVDIVIYDYLTGEPMI